VREGAGVGAGFGRQENNGSTLGKYIDKKASMTMWKSR